MRLIKSMCVVCFACACLGIAVPVTPQQERKASPADGHTIHVLAPHQIDGKAMGPYHHYCKAVSEEILECLIYESTEPAALLKQVEYFVAKKVSRANVSLSTWNSSTTTTPWRSPAGACKSWTRRPRKPRSWPKRRRKPTGSSFICGGPTMPKPPAARSSIRRRSATAAAAFLSGLFPWRGEANRGRR